MITIRKIPDSIVNLKRGSEEYGIAVAELEITDNETYRLLQQYPLAANAGGNHAFVTTLDDAFEPIIIADLVDENGEQLQGMALIAAIGTIMVQDDRSRSIHCSLSDIRLLTESTHWKIWAKLIDDESVLKIKASSIGISIDKRKTLENNQQIASDAVRSLF